MNQRIQQLAKQAQEDYVGYQGKGLYYEIFAKLIVQECAELARQHNLEKADRSHMIHKVIQKHFGVE
jgi:hypothetical protein